MRSSSPKKGEPPGALGVLFCGTLEKRHPYTRTTYPRFVVLTAQALHWFRRPERTELLGEPRGMINLSWVRRAFIVGADRRELVLEFDAEKTLRHASSSDSLRGVGSTSKFLGSSRSFLAPTATAALAWRAAVDLATRQQDDRFSTISTATVNPVSLDEYFTREVAKEMEDGYGHADFLEALGDLVESDESYAQHEAPAQGSPLVRRNRVDTKVVVASYNQRVIGRDLAYRTTALTFDAALGDAEGLILTLRDGCVATFATDDLLRHIGTTLASVVSARDSDERRVLTIAVSGGEAAKVPRSYDLDRVACCVALAVSLTQSARLIWKLVATAALGTVINALLRRKPPQTTSCAVDIVGESQLGRAWSEDLAGQQEVDAKFIAAAKGDKAEAARKWGQSLQWRRRSRVDDVLTEPQPFFDAIKDAYPHWLGGRTRRNELVYWERVGHVDVDKLKNSGCTLDALIRHYIFFNEWTWKVLSPAPSGPDSFQVVIIDVAGVRISQVGGLRLEYFRACADIAQQHYPERTSKYVIINAPAWLPVAWRILEPLLQPETRSKVVVRRPGKDTKDILLELLEPHHVPECYGGTFAPGQSIDQARRKTPEETACKAFVDKIHVRNRASSSI